MANALKPGVAAIKLFPYAHATHPQWRMAANLVLAQLRAQIALHGYAERPTLGLLYITDRYGAQASELLAYLRTELPDVIDWAGCVGVGIVANNVEYFDEPALALMLLELPRDEYRIFSGLAPLGTTFKAATALVHGDAKTLDLAELIGELAQRTTSASVFGGLASSRSQALQFALTGNAAMLRQGAAGGVLSGGLSGVAFGSGVALLSRVTQGCAPVARAHQITAADQNVVLALDGQAALSVLLRELELSLDQPQQALQVLRRTMVGLNAPVGSTGAVDLAGLTSVRGGHFGADVLVRQIIGFDPARAGVAVAATIETGMLLSFCQRNVAAARADLTRICAEIREELEPQERTLEVTHALAKSEAETAPHPARGIAGAIYVSCVGRGGAYFGAPSAELQIIRRALGDVPLVGFFASGEIARQQLYGYSAVLTVFTGQASGRTDAA